MQVKKCLKCDKKKSIIHYGKHPSNDDGYQIWCYECQAKYQRGLYQEHAESKKAQVYARRERMSRLLDKVKATNPCKCGEDEPLCLTFYSLSKKAPRVTKNSGVQNIKEALNGSAVVCLNCRVKIDAGLLDVPAEPLKWTPSDIEPEKRPKPKPKKEAPRPALPPGVQESRKLQ